MINLPVRSNGTTASLDLANWTKIIKTHYGCPVTSSSRMSLQNLVKQTKRLTDYEFRLTKLHFHNFALPFSVLFYNQRLITFHYDRITETNVRFMKFYEAAITNNN